MMPIQFPLGNTCSPFFFFFKNEDILFKSCDLEEIVLWKFKGSSFSCVV